MRTLGYHSKPDIYTSRSTCASCHSHHSRILTGNWSTLQIKQIIINPSTVTQHVVLSPSSWPLCRYHSAKCKWRLLTISHRLRPPRASFLPLVISNRPPEGSTDLPREILPCTLSPSSWLVSLGLPVTCCKLLRLAKSPDSILKNVAF